MLWIFLLFHVLRIPPDQNTIAFCIAISALIRWDCTCLDKDHHRNICMTCILAQA